MVKLMNKISEPILLTCEEALREYQYFCDNQPMARLYTKVHYWNPNIVKTKRKYVMRDKEYPAMLSFINSGGFIYDANE